MALFLLFLGLVIPGLQLPAQSGTFEATVERETQITINLLIICPCSSDTVSALLVI